MLLSNTFGSGKPTIEAASGVEYIDVEAHIKYVQKKVPFGSTWAAVETNVFVTNDESAAALTRSNDTNVTLTLTGDAATALLKAVNIAVGWQGTLDDSRITSATTWNNKQNALGYTPENIANKDASSGYVGLTLFKINFKNALNTITSFFSNANTIARTYLFPDKDGTVAMTSDIPSVSPATLSKSDDTNVTLTLTGTPASALLQAVNIAVGWSGTLADGRIASASTWNNKIGGSGTANEIAYFSAASTIGSLSTSTYPSLTELSYVKGGTSPFQTQINALAGASWVKILAQSASGSAVIDFTGLSNTYNTYKIVITDLIPATNGDDLNLRVGTGGTPTYQSGAGAYGWTWAYNQWSAGAGVLGSMGDTKINLVNTSMSNTGTHPTGGEILILNPSQSSADHVILSDMLCRSASNLFRTNGGGIYLSSTAVTAIRIYCGSGNITSGTFTLYGIT